MSDYEHAGVLTDDVDLLDELSSGLAFAGDAQQVTVDADHMRQVIEMARRAYACPVPTVSEEMVSEAASAIWEEGGMAGDQDRCDQTIDDLDKGHEVFRYARAALEAALPVAGYLTTPVVVGQTVGLGLVAVPELSALDGDDVGAQNWISDALDRMRHALRTTRRGGVCGQTIDAVFRNEYAVELAVYHAMLCTPEKETAK